MKHLEESLAREIKGESKTATAEQAKKMGLIYAGFGRYLNKDGKVAYTVVNGKLVPYKGSEELDGEYQKASEPKETDKKKKVDPKKEFQASLDQQSRQVETDTKKVQKLTNDGYKANKNLIQAHQQNYSQLDPNALEALNYYTNEGYQSINRYLYKGHDEGATMAQDRQLVNMISTIDSAIDSSEAPFPYSVYMGLSPRYKPATIVPGEQYHFRGYMSTALDPMSIISAPAAETGKESEKVILQIEINQGHKALHIDALPNASTSDMETLLPRGSSVRVASGPHLVPTDVFNNSAIGKSDGESKVYLYHCLLVQDEDE